jgi:hypothetical protein
MHAIDSIPAQSLANRLLIGSARFWFVVAAIGQGAFIAFIALAYGSAAIRADFVAWNEPNHIVGYVTGDGFGNAAVISHVLLAGIVTTMGLLQMLPALRARWPKWHRWNGRAFVVIAMITAVSGLWMTWIRGARLSTLAPIGTTVNGMLILLVASYAWYLAINKRFVEHQRWATHLFLLVNGVWFLRVGMMAWFLLNQGPRGNTAGMDGPFDLTWSFASFLLPMAVYEWYRWAKSNTRAAPKIYAAIAIIAFTVLTGIGSFGAYWMMWRPHM